MEGEGAANLRTREALSSFDIPDDGILQLVAVVLE